MRRRASTTTPRAAVPGKRYTNGTFAACVSSKRLGKSTDRTIGVDRLKSQAPSSKSQLTPNDQIPRKSPALIATVLEGWEFLWDLAVGSGWDLGFGAWDSSSDAKIGDAISPVPGADPARQRDAAGQKNPDRLFNGDVG